MSLLNAVISERERSSFVKCYNNLLYKVSTWKNLEILTFDTMDNFPVVRTSFIEEYWAFHSSVEKMVHVFSPNIIIFVHH